MTTRKSMEKALRAEGWKPAGHNSLIDPVRGHWYNKATDLATAYRIAMRRKAARESRRLKAAGWVAIRFPEGWLWITWKRRGNFPRTRALSSLTQEGGAK